MRGLVAASPMLGLAQQRNRNVRNNIFIKDGKTLFPYDKLKQCKQSIHADNCN